jgi:hypothetical protein
MEMTDWASKAWPYYSVPFELIIQFIIFIGLEIKRKDKSDKKENTLV